MLVQELARAPGPAADEGPRVIQGPGENAGVVDIGDGFAVVFKMESHNHPSYIAALPGSGYRSRRHHPRLLTMGAGRSPASTRCGSAPRSPPNRGAAARCRRWHRRLRQLPRVPTVGGELAFDSAYDGNILVNASPAESRPRPHLLRPGERGREPLLYVAPRRAGMESTGRRWLGRIQRRRAEPAAHRASG